MKSNFKFDPSTGTMKAVDNKPKDIKKQEEPPKQEIVKMNLEKQQIAVNLLNEDEPEIVFKQQSDYKMFQILDEDSRAVMGYIGGYGLDISFNLQELKGVEKIEQFLEALKGLFGKIITEQILNQNN